MKPTEPIQLIIGTNGSGKSSLMSEISPLPANANDFDKEGSKKVILTNKGMTYELLSSFNPSARHSFKRVANGIEEELNPGGTGAVQKELVRQEFSITPEIQELILGKLKFHQMGPSQRKEWFIQLSETNYDYAIGVYNKLRERLRDTTGALKLAKKRLVTESSKLLDIKERTALENEVEELHGVLSKLMEFRKPVEHDIISLRNSEARYLELIETNAKLIISRKNKLCLSNYSNMEEIENHLQELKNKASVNSQLIDSMYEEFTKIDEAVQSIKQTGGVSVQQDIDNFKLKQSQLRLNRNICTTPILNATEVYRAFESVYPAIEATLLEIATNDDRRFTQKTRDENYEKYIQFSDHLQRSKNIRVELVAKKAHQEEHKMLGETKCPNCSHTWNIGFNPLVYQTVCDNLDKINTEISKTEEIIEKHKKFHEEVEQYLSQYRAIINTFKSWPVLNVLWDHLLDKKFILESPSRALQECNLFLIDLKSELECEQYENKIQEFNKQLELLKQVEFSDIDRLTKQRQQLESNIHEKTIVLGKLRTEITNINTTLTDIKTIFKLNDELQKIATNAKQTNADAVETLNRTAILQAIREIQSLLAKIEEALNFINLQKGIIEDLQNQINQLEIDEQSLKALVNELSPTDGLIAEGLMGFIKLFINQMNAFIKKIWTYPLVIIPCQFDDNNKVELDYKFPVKVKDHSIPDVSKGSTGMLKVIDLAFQITALKHLGLSDNPLFLDEWSSGLDDAHRTTGTNAIKSLMEQHLFKQCFTVNHYYAEYGTLVNSQVCVLNKDNVVIPSNMKYNTHVVMK